MGRVYGAVIMDIAIVRVDPVHFDKCRLRANRPPTLRSSQPTYSATVHKCHFSSS